MPLSPPGAAPLRVQAAAAASLFRAVVSADARARGAADDEPLAGAAHARERGTRKKGLKKRRAEMEREASAVKRAARRRARIRALASSSGFTPLTKGAKYNSEQRHIDPSVWSVVRAVASQGAAREETHARSRRRNATFGEVLGMPTSWGTLWTASHAKTFLIQR